MKHSKTMPFQCLCIMYAILYWMAASPLAAISYNPADFAAAIPPQTVTVQNQQGTAVFDSEFYLICPGRPKLPVQTVRILLPEDADLGALTYTLKNVQEEDLGTGWEVEIAGPFDDGDGTIIIPKQIKYVDGKDVSLYSTNAYYPSSWTGPIKAGNMRRFKVAHVGIYPYRYNPVTKGLKRITSATLIVAASPDPNYVPLKNPKTFSSPEATSLFFLKNHAANMYAFSTPSAFETYYPSYISSSLLGAILQAPKLLPLLELPYFPSRTYLIITTNYIVSDASPPSQKLESFILCKESRLFDVILVTENKTYEIVNGHLQLTSNQGWGGNWGQVGAENIRNYLTADVNGLPRWDAWDIEHLLLIGCPDPEDGTVPMKTTDPYFEITDENAPSHNWKLPTDLYYSELTENWISPASGKVAPLDRYYNVSIDLLPEVSVTRIPVTQYGTSIGELDTILEKIIEYTIEPQSGIAWRKNVLLPIKPISWFYSMWAIGETLMEICQQNGFGVHRIYDILCGYKIDHEFSEKLREAVKQGVVAPQKVEDYEDAFKAMQNVFIQEPWFSSPANWQALVDYFQELELEYDNGLLGAPQDDDTYNDDGTRTAYNEDIVRDAWLSQDFGFVEWISHGAYDMAIQVFDTNHNNNFPPLDNDHPAFVFMNSCLNANPYEELHLGYNTAFKLLYHGAIGTIASSSITYAGIDNFDVTWLRNMIEEQLDLGTARTFSVARQYGVASDYNLFAFNPYGDSTVGLFTCSTK